MYHYLSFLRNRQQKVAIEGEASYPGPSNNWSPTGLHRARCVFLPTLTTTSRQSLKGANDTAINLTLDKKMTVTLCRGILIDCMHESQSGIWSLTPPSACVVIQYSTQDRVQTACIGLRDCQQCQVSPAASSGTLTWLGVQLANASRSLGIVKRNQKARSPRI